MTKRLFVILLAADVFLRLFSLLQPEKANAGDLKLSDATVLVGKWKIEATTDKLKFWRLTGTSTSNYTERAYVDSTGGFFDRYPY